MKKNNKTIILVGKTASGKSTTAKILESTGYTRIVTDTTRPIRAGEQDGVDYHFRTPEEFQKLEESGYYAETVTYNASFGVCSYGSSKQAYETEDKAIIVLNPYGVIYVKRNVEAGNYTSIYLHNDEETLIKRLRSRGDEEAEIEHRLIHDREDFAAMSEVCDHTLYVKDGETPEEIVARVLSIVEKENTGVNLAFCIDDKGGMMFSKRRLSKDEALRQHMLNMVNDMGGSILVTPYTAKQFDPNDNIKVYDKPWEYASPKDIVFVEETDPAKIECKIRSVIVYKWNRSYPSDLRCTLDFNALTTSNVREFPGKSHELITEEIYTK